MCLLHSSEALHKGRLETWCSQSSHLSWQLLLFHPFDVLGHICLAEFPAPHPCHLSKWAWNAFIFGTPSFPSDVLSLRSSRFSLQNNFMPLNCENSEACVPYTGQLWRPPWYLRLSCCIKRVCVCKCFLNTNALPIFYWVLIKNAYSSKPLRMVGWWLVREKSYCLGVSGLLVWAGVFFLFTPLASSS